MYLENDHSSDDVERHVQRRKRAKKKRPEQESATTSTESSSAGMLINIGASTSAAAGSQVWQLSPASYPQMNKYVELINRMRKLLLVSLWQT